LRFVDSPRVWEGDTEFHTLALDAVCTALSSCR
jgi:hypothetical protein